MTASTTLKLISAIRAVWCASTLRASMRQPAHIIGTSTMAMERGTISTTHMTLGIGIMDGAADGHGDHGAHGMAAYGATVRSTHGPIGDGDLVGTDQP